MHEFKIINVNVPEDIFDNICFTAYNDAVWKENKDTYIPTELKSGVFKCTGKNKLNYDIMSNVEDYLTVKNYISGRDYTINMLIQNRDD